MPDSPRLLVIDDEIDVGKFVSAAAQGIGLYCVATTDAANFLKELTPQITLILLDLMMPGTDGVELLRLLADRKCTADIILMSGVGSRVLETAEQFAQTLDLSIVGHLNKPFRLKELQRMLTSNIAPAALIEASPKPQDALLEEELRRAILNDEFVLHYQPQIEVSTGKVIGVEALVRWQHPERGLVFPDHFISRFEALDLIDELGWLVFDRGLSEVGQFADGSGSVPMLSLNVSVVSLRNLKFPDAFIALAKKHNISASNVTLEITESGLIKDMSQTLEVLTRLRMKQVLLSIDDFGTGYAMMQQLRNIPATELKIGKSFIQNLHLHERDRVMVQETIEIGHKLAMKVVGEGVETQEQFDFLRAHHCDAVQGYLFSRPLAAKQLVDWLAEYRSHNASTPRDATRISIHEPARPEVALSKAGGGSAVALMVVIRKSMDLNSAITGTLLMGSGISAMHCIGTQKDVCDGTEGHLLSQDVHLGHVSRLQAQFPLDPMPQEQM